ncbi:MAG: zinc-binding dehydrogenase [Thermodesulfobacteriota bacterium]
MKAAVFTEVQKVIVTNKPKPVPGPGQALVKVERCGICGSDLHGYLAGPVMEVFYAFGTVMGHECSGVVAEVGDGVSNVKTGDRVVIYPSAFCGACPPCLDGKTNICLNAVVHGIGLTTLGDGAFAEYLLITRPDQMLHKLPEGVTFEEGAIVEPLATSLHGVRKSRFKPGDVVVVIGAGPIGLGTIQFLKLGGAGKIITLEISPERTKAALELGADLVLNPQTEGDFLAMKLAELTGGLGADIVFECSGVPFAFQNSINFIKPGGQVMVVGITEKDTPLSCVVFTIKEAEMKGCFAYTINEFKMVIDFIARKKINTAALISTVIALDDIQEKGFQRLAAARDLVKILIRP